MTQHGLIHSPCQINRVFPSYLFQRQVAFILLVAAFVENPRKNAEAFKRSNDCALQLLWWAYTVWPHITRGTQV